MSLKIVEKVYAQIYSLPPQGTPGFGTGKLLYGDGSGYGYQTGTLLDIGQRIFNLIVLIAGVLAILYLIWSGIQYIISAGNADRIKAARSGVINAIIGIVIIVAAYAIVRFAISIANTINTAV